MSSNAARWLLLVVVAIALAAGCGSGSDGSHHPTGHGNASSDAGTITVHSTVKLDGRGSVAVSGIIVDRGRSFPADAEGNSNSDGGFEEVHLRNGTFLLDERALNDVKPSGGIDRSRCSLNLTFTAMVPVELGTGSYAGLHGDLHGQARLRYVVPRYKAGPHKGQCDPKAKPPQDSNAATMNATGTVTR